MRSVVAVHVKLLRMPAPASLLRGEELGCMLCCDGDGARSCASRRATSLMLLQVQLCLCVCACNGQRCCPRQ